jgi:hypothetical protein
MTLTSLYEAQIHSRQLTNVKRWVMDPMGAAKQNGDWYNKGSVYADKHATTTKGKDAKLLSQYRGKGLA